MFGVSFWELVAILTVLVLLLRPEDIPKVTRKLGRLYGYLALFTTGLSREIEIGRREAEAEQRNVSRRKAKESDG